MGVEGLFHHQMLLKLNAAAWPQVYISCFLEYLTVPLQIIFIGSIAIRLIVQKLGMLTDKNSDRCLTGKYHLGRVKLGFSYIASISCCLFLLGSHLLDLLMLLSKDGCSCVSSLLTFSSEISQIISWCFALAIVYNFKKARSEKLPRALRYWWICTFIQTVGYVSLDIHSFISTRRSPRMGECTNLLDLLVCLCLFGLSIRGTTGITFCSTGIEAPLLQNANENSVESKRVSLYGRATLLQLVTFSWLNPLLAIGIKEPLDQEQVPDIDGNDSAAFLSQTFGDILDNVKEKHGMCGSLIYQAIFRYVRKKAAINAFFAVVNASASFVGPSLISSLVKFLNGERRQGLESGYVIVGAFLSAKVVETVAQRQWIFGARQLGMRLRAALISHIYKKGLYLSSQSKQSRTSGEIINYMSVDIQRITDFMWYLNLIWMLPIQISLAIFVLHMNLGLGSMATLAATFLLMTCNIPITRTQKKFQSKIMDAKDERMKATSEVLKNIKTLKLQAWDTHYLKKIENMRGAEYNCLWKSLRLNAFAAFIFWGSPTFISIATFGSCILMGIPLTAGNVLTALATFSMLQDPIFNLPDVLSVFAQAKVSVDRVASYLQEEEIQSDAVEYLPRNEADYDIEVDRGTFGWDPDPEFPTLREIQLLVKKGMKVAICGTVGGGKSSLLSCILGEIPKLAGTVKVSGTKAYVPQSPWILTGNIRENILFGLPYAIDKYERTVHACALSKDFELFGNGDLTEIGERGINMSGGQKQRIQMARAVYQDADIYLLDDPFSALDAHTGTQLFEECLMGILKDKTIIYVTHQLEFLPAADLILVMQDGRIVQAGRFEELLRQNIGFEVLVGAHSQAFESIVTAKNCSRAPQAVESNQMRSSENVEEDADDEAQKHFQSGDKHDSEQDIGVNITDRGKLTQEEEREKGSIAKEIYWAYLKAVKGGVLIPVILVAQSLFQILQVASNYWIAWASPPTPAMEPTVGMDVLFFVYIILSVGSALCVLARAILVAITGLLTSEKLFRDMLHCILHAPMSFFDSTPAGRILNRASTDQSVLDLELPGKLGWCAFSVIRILGTIAVMSQVAWPVFAVFIPVTIICMWYEQYYMPTARELARLSGIQQTPVLHHFAESLAGAAIIRAFGHVDRFSNSNLVLIDNHSRPWFHNVSAMEWLCFRLNVLSNFVFAFSLILLVSLPEGFISPSIAGLAVTYGLSLNVQQASIIWNICNAENKMISVERILQYSKIKSEAPLHVGDCRPPNSWPEHGTICFKNLEVRYAVHFPPVLKNITCLFPGKKKIGVVGRTGSGKSTLIQALFRIVEPREGTIVIDGIDICKIGLHDLRSRLSIIPQDPTMFEGTVRGNLDPLEEYPDQRIWEALDKCQLVDLIHSRENKLDSKVVENGDNWSAGQKQLFCLGRSLLQRSNILVLDEATASIDSNTDNVLQEIIRQEFKNCTVITIAHRIHTVIDSDLVLVLSDGRILEYDSPARLLEREESSFSKLIKEYSMRSQCLNNLTTALPQENGFS